MGADRWKKDFYLNSIYDKMIVDGIGIKVEIDFLKNGIPYYNTEKQLVDINYITEDFDGTIELQGKQGNIYCMISYLDRTSLIVSKYLVIVAED